MRGEIILDDISPGAVPSVARLRQRAEGLHDLPARFRREPGGPSVSRAAL